MFYGHGGSNECRADGWAEDGETGGAAPDVLVGCGEMPSPFSLHAQRRAARRNVIPDAIAYVLAYGRVLHRTGITFHFLAARDIPETDRRAAWATRLVGTVVLVGLDGEIITVYRNRRALPALRRKMKYRLAPGGPVVQERAWSGDDGQPMIA